jgi:four helix bundle protein
LDFLKEDAAMSELFDHERLDVYKLELSFITWVAALIREVKKTSDMSVAEVCDQLDRASLSSLLNTAEGNGKRQRRVRGRYFDDARGSAMESAACLDALVAKCIINAERAHEGKTMLRRIVEMLTRLVELYSNISHEDEEAYDTTDKATTAEDEDDDEDEHDFTARSR